MSQPTTPPTSVRQGFTLVELLVVIAIIGILMAMLLPSLARARAQAQLVQCQSNLRQIYAAVKMYSNDYRDKFPDDYTVGGAWFRRTPGQKNPADPTSLPERYGLPGVLQGITETDVLGEALKRRGRYLDASSKVWVCPAARDYMQDFGVTYVASLLTVKQPDDFNFKRGDWVSLQRGRERNDGIFFVWDNAFNLPFSPGFRRGRSDPNPTLLTTRRDFPHPYQKKKALAINILLLSGAIDTKVYKDPLTADVLKQ